MSVYAQAILSRYLTRSIFSEVTVLQLSMLGRLIAHKVILTIISIHTDGETEDAVEFVDARVGDATNKGNEMKGNHYSNAIL